MLPCFPYLFSIGVSEFNGKHRLTSFFLPRESFLGSQKQFYVGALFLTKNLDTSIYVLDDF